MLTIPNCVGSSLSCFSSLFCTYSLYPSCSPSLHHYIEGPDQFVNPCPNTEEDINFRSVERAAPISHSVAFQEQQLPPWLDKTCMDQTWAFLTRLLHPGSQHLPTDLEAVRVDLSTKLLCKLAPHLAGMGILPCALLSLKPLHLEMGTLCSSPVDGQHADAPSSPPLPGDSPLTANLSGPTVEQTPPVRDEFCDSANISEN